MKKENLPYRVFDFAASLFAGERTGFSHQGMNSFFCHELNKHPAEIDIPNGINRIEKFKWWLGQFSVAGQRRTLENLCRNEYSHAGGYYWPSDEERRRLLQMLGSSPIDMPSTLTRIDVTAIHESWKKALVRVSEDPDGAITAARALLESVCKQILDEIGIEYSESADLPKLYSLAANALNLAPSQHTEEAFKRILGGAHSVVDGLANIRNRLGDAHGQGKLPIRPRRRHAELAVNMAGSIASFMLATLEAKTEGGN